MSVAVPVRVWVRVAMFNMHFSNRPSGCLPFEARDLAESYDIGDTQVIALAGVDLDI